MTKVAASPRNLASSTALRPRAFSITPPQQTEEYFENRGLTGLKAATKGMPGEDVLSSFKSFEERFPAEFIKWAEGADADQSSRQTMPPRRKPFPPIPPFFQTQVIFM